MTTNYASAWVSQWDASMVHDAGPTACFRACRVICFRLGQPIAQVREDTIQRYQMVTTVQGMLVTTDEEPAGSTYLKQACRAVPLPGRVFDPPLGVIVGIDYKPGISQNRDKITDHYVVLCGWDEDSKELRGLNPGASLPPDIGYNVAFRFSETDHMWYRTWPGRLETTHISMVVPDWSNAASLPVRP